MPAVSDGAERYHRSAELFARSVQVIPKGISGHKNPDGLLPGHSPYYAERAEGGRCWDVDGNEYLDLLCSYGPVILGHNHLQVEDTVRRQMAKGACFNHPDEAMVELAERLVELVPGADWAVFAKNGSDVTAWCSVYPSGVLPEDKANVLEMDWNRLDELEALVTEHRNQIAAGIAAPYHHPIRAAQQMPAEGFWRGVRQICDREGMLFILDDTRAGFQQDLGGSHTWFGIDPDLICFGKSLANGHPFSVAMGREALHDAAEAVFISGTF